MGKKIYSETSYYYFEGNNIYTIDGGDEVTIGPDYAKANLKSADDFATTEKKNKTELAAIFINNPGVALTVCFNKQLKPEDIVTRLKELYPNKGGKLISEEDFLKKAKSVSNNLIKGEERVARGYHTGILTDEGRMKFTDMDKVQDKTKSYSTREIQVDTRNILWLVVNNVKYVLK